MWNPSQTDVSEINALRKAHPAAERQINTLLDHLAVACRKIAFYEELASPDTIAKAEEAGFAGMTTLEKAAFVTKSKGGEQRVPMKDWMAAIATPAEREALAKRAPFNSAGAPVGQVVNGGGVVDSAVLATVRQASKDFLPAGHCRMNR